MNICIFCSAADVDEKYVKAAQEFCALLAQKGHSLVWGGSYNGLMRVIADSTQQNGGKVIGVSVENFRDRAHKNADEMFFVKDLAERKAQLLERSDALVALVGGSGTLDEVINMIELKKYKVHNKPIVFLNTDGFYDGLENVFTRMNKEGFLHFPIEEIVCFAKTPRDAFEYIENYGA